MKNHNCCPTFLARLGSDLQLIGDDNTRKQQPSLVSSAGNLEIYFKENMKSWKFVLEVNCTSKYFKTRKITIVVSCDFAGVNIFKFQNS